VGGFPDPHSLSIPAQLLEADVRTPRNLLSLIVVVLSAIFFYNPVPVLASNSNIYIAQSAMGANSGADCADAYAVGFFNKSSDWGTGASQIAPGTTVHLCGTISSALTIEGSGSSTSPITILFESGAMMSAPNWGEGGAAIGGSGINYITIDGGTNGTIQATSNGTGLATQVDDTGVALYNCSNCIIRNLTVSNMYVHTYTPTDESGENTGGIYIANGNNIAMYSNTVHDAKWGVAYSFNTAGNSNVTLYNNIVYHCDHGVALESGDPNASLSNATVYGNNIYDGYLWDDNANDNHHDGIHTWAVQSGTSISGLMVYSNYIHGNWGFGLNAFIYMEVESGGLENNSLAFNNLLVDSTTLSHYGCGYLCVLGSAAGIYNNTIIGSSTASGLGIDIYGASDTIENNTVGNMLEVVALAGAASTSVATWDYNNYYNVGAQGWNGGTPFSAWQGWCATGVCKPDTHGSMTNPELSATYQPTSSSAALLNRGVNLSSIAVTALDSDISGAGRPLGTCTTLGSSPCWVIGAYQSDSASPARAINVTAAAIQQ
jgi:hypothetical protein